MCVTSVTFKGLIRLNYTEIQFVDSRTGRNRQGFDTPAMMEQREMLMEAARAWMDLSPAMSTIDPATVEVGQPTRLLIQCTLPGKNNVHFITA